MKLATLRSVKWLVPLLALGLALAPSVARADSSTVLAGKRAVRYVLERRFDELARLKFDSARETPISSSEVRVTGEGYCKIRGDQKTFRYSVKVRRNSRDARDVRIEFPSGLVVTDEGDWRPVPEYNYYLRFREPSRGSEVRGPRVTFAGEALGSSVRLSVYNSRNERVAYDTVSERDGWWSTVLSLNSGNYRAVAELTNGRERQEVRFVVDRGEWGGDVDVDITRPTKGQTINGGTVSVDGRTDYREVRLQLTDRFNRVIQEKRVRSSGGRFYASFGNVLSGSYKVRAYTSGIKGVDEVIFQVRNNDFGGSGGTVSVSVSSPRNNQVLTSSRVTFSGTARGSDLVIEVYDRNNRRVGTANVDVPSSGRWSTSMNMPGPGPFRAVIRAKDGRASQTVSFTYNPGGFGGSGGSGNGNGRGRGRGLDR